MWNGVDFMDQKLEQAYLYDFYGDLLKERQRRIYEDFIFNDLSLGEIAQEEGISRQGVHDMVKRCTKALEGYEQRLHLVQKFLSTKQRVEQIHALVSEFRTSLDASVTGQSVMDAARIDADMIDKINQIEQLSNAIIEEM